MMSSFLKQKAKRLYITTDQTLRDISLILNCSFRALQRLSAQEGWKKLQKSYQATLGEAYLELPGLYMRLIGKASLTLDAQDVRDVIEIGNLLEKDKGGK